MRIYNSTSSTVDVASLPKTATADVFIVKYSNIFQTTLASLADRSTIGNKVISLLNSGLININVANMVNNGSVVTTLTLTDPRDTITLGWNGNQWFVINNIGTNIS